jgi:hypothetical protein
MKFSRKQILGVLLLLVTIVLFTVARFYLDRW